MPEEKKFIWHCQRMGGTDQAILSTMEELRHLRELDPKIWGALSCPAVGLEFDKKTLQLLDIDGDGRIRVPEILDTVDWICARVNDTADIPAEPTVVPISAIDTTNPAGKRLSITARTILKGLGAAEETISAAQVQTAAESAAEQNFNGDGILPAFEALDKDVKRFIEAGLSVVGGAQDAGGTAGLNIELADAFVKELTAWQNWHTEVEKAPQPVKKCAEAWALLNELKPRVDDYFLRCELAAFAPQAQPSLNAETRLAEAAEKSDIDPDILLTMPLAHVNAGQELPLLSGVNPVWSARVKRFASLVSPLLSREKTLSQNDWQKVQDALAPYGAALNNRPHVAEYEAGSFAKPENPDAALDALGATGVKELLDPALIKKFKDLCAKDLANAAASEDIAELEKLVLLYCNIHRLLMNFVSFYDFYMLRPNVTFRAGTLFIDGRSCQLCVPVGDVAKHSNMAATSQLCLLYCECTRYAADGSVSETRTIMAVLTAGSDDVLMEGRNGVFVDNTGTDWDARLIKIVHNPISFNQAIWSPYKRISSMVGDAVAKFAASKRDEGLAAAQKGVASLTAAKPGQPVPFDISKGVGIFAAVGIALGAIGTAIGSIAQALFSLAWWQFPLLIGGIFLIISGPSVFLAWLKFRRRTFGPVLEASGWAVNSQLPINLKLGSALTSVAKVPENIERQSVLDPFREEKKSHTGLWICVGILICAMIFGGWLWHSGKLKGIVAAVKQATMQTEQPASKTKHHDKKAAEKPEKKAAEQQTSHDPSKSDKAKDAATQDKESKKNQSSATQEDVKEKEQQASEKNVKAAASKAAEAQKPKQTQQEAKKTSSASEKTHEAAKDAKESHEQKDGKQPPENSAKK